MVATVLPYCHAGKASVPVVGMKKNGAFKKPWWNRCCPSLLPCANGCFLKLQAWLKSQWGFEAILEFFQLKDTSKTHPDFTVPFGLQCDTHWRRPSAAPAGSIVRIESNMDENSDCCHMCHPPNPSSMCHTAQSNARKTRKNDERPLN